MGLTVFEGILLLLLVATAVAVLFIKNSVTSVVVFMSYSSIMAVIWVLLEAPDLAITEAAVGAGITSVLFFLTLRRVGKIGRRQDKENDDAEKGERK